MESDSTDDHSFDDLIICGLSPKKIKACQIGVFDFTADIKTDLESLQCALDQNVQSILRKCDGLSREIQNKIGFDRCYSDSYVSVCVPSYVRTISIIPSPDLGKSRAGQDRKFRQLDQGTKAQG
jgi:hypothetical protein